MTPSTRPPIIVMGASTGGIHALKTVIGALPSDVAAALLVVLHRSEAFPDRLPEILQQITSLPVAAALHGERLAPGRVYVAPPDNHLQVRAQHVEVVRGPRENAARPAVNVLFRTAAAAHGPRVIGVVLTGHLDCGTAGVRAIKARGGATIAQDPASAECGEMPESAIGSGAVDEVLPLETIAARLIELVKRARDAAPPEAPSRPAMAYSFVTCPHCHGSMKESTVDATLEFECHVGHRFSLRSLYAEQAEEVETALWAAMRALEEGAAVAKRMTDASTGSLRERFAEKERVMAGHARTIQEMLLSRVAASPIDLVPPRTGGAE